MIDFHSHILPAMDDGSRNAEESIHMLELSMKQGVKEIVLTPHFYPNREDPSSFLARREESYKVLKKVLKRGMPSLHLGAEVQFFDSLSKIDQLDDLAIGGTHLILVEMPFMEWNGRMLAELDSVMDRGLQVILAHIERYSCYKDRGAIEELNERGYLIQSNGEAYLQGFFSRRAFRYLESGLTQLLGSDCHRSDTRKPNLDLAMEAIEKRCGESVCNELKSQSMRILHSSK